ncbi:MAG: YggS family pyridoxal phosphate-dependent enzyme [Bacteroidaceae bacterium]|nr:YggS family pyridoxal phosphate-dependent enzyme [Bacteroidaceae bacterium]
MYSDSIAGRLETVRASLKEGVQLVAISKYHPKEKIEEAYAAGQRRFGENYILEMAEKAAVLPKDIEWHFTGHVQTNKIKFMAPFVHTIQSVDSFHALSEINKHALRNERTIHCLLQLHVAQEDTKYGLTPDECLHLLRTEPWRELKGVRITGLMAMATNTNNEVQIRKEFHSVRTFFEQVKKEFFADDTEFSILSEGMTDDYPIAISEGANMVRIGSAIFGPRH